jgi:hypothetical protein
LTRVTQRWRARVSRLRNATLYGHEQRTSRTEHRRPRGLRVLGLRRNIGAAHGARGPGPQPRVDAVDVEDVAAGGQRAHLLAVRELRQAHGAVCGGGGAGGGGPGVVLAVGRDGQRGEAGRVQPVAAAPAEVAEGAADAGGQAAAAAHEALEEEEADEDEGDGEDGEDDDGREQDAAAEGVALLLLRERAAVRRRVRPRWCARHGRASELREPGGKNAVVILAALCSVEEEDALCWNGRVCAFWVITWDTLGGVAEVNAALRK